MTEHCQNLSSCVAKSSEEPAKLLLDGETLTPEALVKIGYSPQLPVDLSEEAWAAVKEGRAVVDRIIERKEVVYGINTGFGNFANVIIPFEQLKQLQENLIRSHSSGVGNPLTPNQTRMLLALRINVLAKGHSGIRPETVRQMLDALNANCLSFVPAKGTVGASGDLAPLSHLALGLMGEGQMWEPRAQQYMPAEQVLKMHGLKPISLHAKEGLALINGTQLITSIGSEAVVRAERIARQADVVAALTVEALKASGTPFHPAIHKARPHTGQIRVAGRMRNLLNFGGAPSEISRSHINCGKVQDSYTLRCIPQVHGIVHDTVNFSHDILFTECNSATDNPMIFADLRAQPMSNSSVARVNGFYPYKLDSEDDVNNSNVNSVVSCVNCDGVCKGDASSSSSSSCCAAASTTACNNTNSANSTNNTPTKPDVTASKAVDAEESKIPSGNPADVSQGIILSGGNFHGEYPAKALDYLTIGIHEIASISERRIERLVNPALSGLPAFLTEGGGLNSGFMIAHCAAAALVSENKTLCHPASVDSISTSAAQEDHVSMGGFAARKALKVVGHVEYCIAVELLCACQAIDFLRPLTTTKPLEAVHKLVRSVAPHWEKDRFMSPDIEAVAKLLRENKIWEAVAPFVDEQFH